MASTSHADFNGVSAAVFQTLLQQFPTLTTRELCAQHVLPATAARQCAYIALLRDNACQQPQQPVEQPARDSHGTLTGLAAVGGAGSARP